MRLLVPICVLLCTFGAVAQMSPVEREKWNTVPRLCGHLYYEHAKHFGDTETSDKILRRTKISLYRRVDGVACCTQDALVQSKQTTWIGTFEFKKQSPGKYCYMAEFQDGTVSIPITFSPPKGFSSCTKMEFAINDKREFTFRHFIEVD